MKTYYDSKNNLWVATEKVSYYSQSKEFKVSSKKSKEVAIKKLKENAKEWKDSFKHKNYLAKTEKHIFEEEIKKWYKIFKEPNNAPSTIRTDTDTINQLCKQFGNKEVEKIDSYQLQAYLNTKKDRAISTQRKTYRMLDMFFKHFYQYEPFKNPMFPLSVPKAKVKRAKRPVLNNEEMELLTNELSKPLEIGVGGYAHGDMLITIMWTGLRYGEACALTVNDIDFEKGVIHVTKQYNSGITKNPKYDSIRDIPIRGCLDKTLLKAMKNKKPNMLLFSNEYNEHLSESNIRVNLKNALSRCDLNTSITIHDLRHTAISRFVRDKFDVHKVSQWAGHKDISTTLNIYYAPVENEFDEDIKLLRVM